ncbi:S8 family serine peptidase [Altererythrobacter salegens]|uniref:S8 family serine peptidase n=1 Tax=Croceibacterium salegens TaxID=1737568 RepID=A0A6I4SWP5_9SPHN|nr:S8 family serine peptidase [Croceibacterium salegens]
MALAVLLPVIPAAAQLAVPGVSLPQVSLPGEVVGRTLENTTETVRETAERLLDLRQARIDRLLQRERETVEADASGAPARRGELLLLDPVKATLDAVANAGFGVVGHERLGSLGLEVARVQLPKGVKLAAAQELLAKAAPGAQIAPDNIYFESGAALAASAGASTRIATIATTVGMIDGAPGKGVAVAAQRGFAKGAPYASDHGSAVASLLGGAGVRRVLAADVYGKDPAGGNALAIARALDWLAGSGAKVATISLVGPNNAVLAKAIAGASRSGMVVVAAVGNDGPAAPPSYPASYPGVVAVTAVDGHGRPLIEAGNALHLDYAAPGADIRAANRNGKAKSVRGTSFATPLVAARLAAALDAGGSWRTTLDREAEDLGPRGADKQFGRGLLCRGCGR